MKQVRSFNWYCDFQIWLKCVSQESIWLNSWLKQLNKLFKVVQIQIVPLNHNKQIQIHSSDHWKINDPNGPMIQLWFIHRSPITTFFALALPQPKDCPINFHPDHLILTLSSPSQYLPWPGPALLWCSMALLFPSPAYLCSDLHLSCPDTLQSWTNSGLFLSCTDPLPVCTCPAMNLTCCMCIPAPMVLPLSHV